MSIYKEFYENITPEKSNEQFASEIRNSTKPVKKFSAKKFMPVGIAAAAMAAVTVTASAAGWDLSGVIHSFFNGGGNAITENIAELTVENVNCRTDETTVEVLGGLKDDIWTTIFVEITRNDGNIFDNSNHRFAYENGEICEETDWELPYDVRLDISYYSALFPRHFVVDDGCPNDNSMTFAVCYETDKLEEFGNTVNLAINSVIIEERFIVGEPTKIGNRTTWPSDTRLLEAPECYWSADIKTEFEEGNARNLTFDESVIFTFYTDAQTHEEYREDEIEFRVKELTASDFSLAMRIEAPVYDEYMYYHPYWTEGEIVLKDGTTVGFGGDNERYTYEQHNTAFKKADPEKPWVVEISFILDRPIDVNEIDYVTINGVRFGF